jgi:predicted signal transduction protein with EAL and GGDEF domain
MESTLAARLEEARRQGDLSEDTDPNQFARQLLVLLQGLRVMTRLGVEPQQLRDAVMSALAPLRAQGYAQQRPSSRETTRRGGKSAEIRSPGQGRCSW